jgi:glyoxylase-like metal-dependent hydrolase (beta-lactamase superfamily II)
VTDVELSRAREMRSTPPPRVPGPPPGVTPTEWAEVFPGVFRFEDSCQVYAVPGPGGSLIIDAGTGAWLDVADTLPAPPVALVLTHFFRDHATGASRAAERGIAVYVPEWEEPILADPALHFLRREAFVVYDNYWSHFAPIEPTKIAGVLRDYEQVRLAGLAAEVVPLPGATITQIGLDVELPGGGRALFCGETIHSRGRVARISPLQYGYNDLPGAWNVIQSARELRRRAPSAILPSLGEPITEDIDQACGELEENLRSHCYLRSGGEASRMLDAADCDRISESVWRSSLMNAHGTFIVSDTGKVLAIDSGWETAFGDLSPSPWTRRPTIRIARAFAEKLGAQGIDVVIPSHFHDDHVAALPLLQRVLGAECWCPDWFADILERPQDFAFPCTWPGAVRVDRRLRAGEAEVWEGVEFHVTRLSGHTRFAAAISWEVDGLRFAHLGDQYHFVQNGENAHEPARGKSEWATDSVDVNHVYRNGAFLSSYRASADWLRSWRPDIVLSGHQRPMWTNDDFFVKIDEFSARYEEMHERTMVLGGDEIHFELDSWGGWLQPYRTHLAAVGPVRLQATVRNPFPGRAQLTVRLVGPTGWRGAFAEVEALGRAEVTCELEIVPTGLCRRQPVAVELIANGRPFGQVAEALVTIGGDGF